MPIHHATVKRASSLGIGLEETEEIYEGARVVRAWIASPSIEITHTDPKHAVAGAELARTLRLEYGLTLTSEFYEGPDGDAIGWAVTDIEGNSTEFSHVAPPDLADVLEQVEDAGLTVTDGEEVEEEASRDIVASKYRALYKERGDPRNCGDWLANILKNVVLDTNGKLVVPLFTDILTANNVAMTGKWADLPKTQARGWQGRYRMNGRLKLEVEVAKAGFLFLPDDEGVEKLPVPADELAALRAKHAKHIKEA